MSYRTDNSIKNHWNSSMRRKSGDASSEYASAHARKKVKLAAARMAKGEPLDSSCMFTSADLPAGARKNKNKDENNYKRKTRHFPSYHERQKQSSQRRDSKKGKQQNGEDKTAVQATNHENSFSESSRSSEWFTPPMSRPQDKEHASDPNVVHSQSSGTVPSRFSSSYSPLKRQHNGGFDEEELRHQFFTGEFTPERKRSRRVEAESPASQGSFRTERTTNSATPGRSDFASEHETGYPTEEVLQSLLSSPARSLTSPGRPVHLSVPRSPFPSELRLM